jgi:hypothetical protein
MYSLDVLSKAPLMRCGIVTLGTIHVSDLIVHCFNVLCYVTLFRRNIVALGALKVLGLLLHDLDVPFKSLLAK